MPWELGYSDGLHGKVAILPISENDTSTESYNGQEYLGLYPYVTAATAQMSGRITLWVNESSFVYTSYEGWMRGEALKKHAA